MILDTDNPILKDKFKRITEGKESLRDKAIAIYEFVRDEIKFGYNYDDNLKASEIIQDGYGQCNTKATVLMALLQMLELPVRIHGFKIDKILQKGVFTGLFYKLAPQKILHSWIEVKIEDNWINLEGFILDSDYISALQNYFPSKQNFCGYGAATLNLQKPQVDWNGQDHTYIQKEGIVEDLGVFSSPDEFYEKHGSNLSGIKKFLYRYLVRHLANWKVSKIRKRKANIAGQS